MHISTSFLGSATRSLVLALSLPATALAQTHQVWVNPQTGNDGTAAINNPNLPYRTINGAIQGILSDPNDHTGTIYALPGLYSESTITANGELFPIKMRDNIHLQGAGAKECVIRRTSSNPTVPSFMPVNNTGGISGDVIGIAPVVSLSLLGPNSTTSIEGFTFQGGDVQVWSWPEATQSARISNCVFDMRDNVPMIGTGPEFGILLIPVWDWHAMMYHPLDIHIFNNTFIQAYQEPGTLEPDLARTSNVAICNVNDPVTDNWWRIFHPDSEADPNPNLRGLSALNIQNNLIRNHPNRSGIAFLGIDSSDTSVQQGTNPGPTNAFDPSDVGGTDSTGKWISTIIGSAPVPKVAINPDGPGPYQDPGFVGEMLGWTFQLSLANPQLRDWRLLPDSVLRNQGSGPIVVGGLGNILQAVNGLTFVENLPTPLAAFDWDGDGHGNARKVGTQPDIGVDEIGHCVVAGCYGNDSKSFDIPFDANRIAPGNPDRFYITTLGGAALQSYVTARPYVPGVGWTISPGTVSTGVPFAGAGKMYLDQATMISLTIGSTLASFWTNPVDGVMHTFGMLHLTATDPNNPSHLNEQILVGNTPNGLKLSELHFEIF